MSRISLENELFNLRFTSKQLLKAAEKARKQSEVEKKKVAKAIQMENTEGARVFAENAIREKNNYLNYLRLSARVDGVASRVENAVRMQTITRSMAGVVRSMDKAMKNMQLTQVQAVMDKFEKQFEDLDVQTEVMDGAMKSSSATATPANEVDSLLMQVADANQLQLNDDFLAVPAGMPKAGVAAPAPASEADELEKRLAALKGL